MRIYVDHGEAYGNLGDEAMLLNALRRLRLYLGEAQFVMPGEPGQPLPPNLPPEIEVVLPPRIVLERTAERLRSSVRLLEHVPVARRFVHRRALFWRIAARWLEVRVALGWPPKALQPFLRALARCDAFYGVGAADFTDYWLEGVVYKAWLYRLCRGRVGATVVAAQGIGPLETRWARRTLARGLASTDILSFRDCALGAAIVEQERIAVRHRIVGDEAMSLPAAGPEETSAYLERAGLANDTPFIAVHFRTTDYTVETRQLAPRLARILDEVAARTAVPLIFVPMSYGEHSGDDAAYGLSIRALMRAPEALHVGPSTDRVGIIKAVVGRARFSLGLSYHVHVFSLSQGHPALILYTGGYYGAKSEGLVGFYGAPSAALDLAATDDEAILGAVRQIVESYETACEHIRSVNARLLVDNDWTLRELASLVGRA